MESDTVKHLEFIQGVINRHNANSFMLKGWAITIASALYALAGTVNEPSLVLISLVPIILFWGLDAFYLSNERCFVDLYRAVASGGYKLPEKAILKKDFDQNPTEFSSETIPSFSMNFNVFKIWRDNHWSEVLKSKTILWFYFPLTITTVFIFMIFFTISMNSQKSVNVNVNALIKSDTLHLKTNEKPYQIINNIYTMDSLRNPNIPK